MEERLISEELSAPGGSRKDDGLTEWTDRPTEPRRANPGVKSKGRSTSPGGRQLLPSYAGFCKRLHFYHFTPNRGNFYPTPTL